MINYNILYDIQITDFYDLMIKMIRILAADYIYSNFEEFFVMFGEDKEDLVETSLKSSILLAVPSSLEIQVFDVYVLQINRGITFSLLLKGVQSLYIKEFRLL